MAGPVAKWWSRLATGPRLLAWRERLLARITLDTRALALMRIGLGLTLLSDVVLRWADVDTLYADGGVISKVAEPWQRSWFWLYDAFGAPDQVRIWLALTALAAVLLVIGFRSQLMMLICWWLTGCLLLRNGLVLQDGDFLLQQLLLCGALLPCGARISLDARRRRGRGPALRQCAGPATALLIFQMMHLYMSTGLIKMRFAHWWQGDGVAFALQADHFATPVGVWLRDSGIWLSPLSWFTILLEALGPLIWLLAPRGSRLRTGVMLAFVALHLGIAATIHVGIFSLVCLVMWLFALPAHWLDHAEAWLARMRGRTARLGRVIDCVPSRRWLHLVSLAILIYLPAAAMLADFSHIWTLPTAPLVPAQKLNLKLRWAVFSSPRRTTGWFLVAATIPGGKRLDLISGGPLSLARPTNILEGLPNQRWRKLWLNFYKSGGGREKQNYLRMLCQNHPEARQIELLYMERAVRLDGTIAAATPKRMGLLKCPAPTRGQFGS